MMLPGQAPVSVAEGVFKVLTHAEAGRAVDRVPR